MDARVVQGSQTVSLSGDVHAVVRPFQSLIFRSQIIFETCNISNLSNYKIIQVYESLKRAKLRLFNIQIFKFMIYVRRLRTNSGRGAELSEQLVEVRQHRQVLLPVDRPGGLRDGEEGVQVHGQRRRRGPRHGRGGSPRSHSRLLAELALR